MPAGQDPLELEEIRELELEFLSELLEEPPGGHNHGRKKTEGGWHPLETDPQDIPSWKRYVDPRKHGTAYTYVRMRCRCPECRKWQSDRMKARRATPVSEEERA